MRRTPTPPYFQHQQVQQAATTILNWKTSILHQHHAQVILDHEDEEKDSLMTMMTIPHPYHDHQNVVAKVTKQKTKSTSIHENPKNHLNVTAMTRTGKTILHPINYNIKEV
jgi:5'(3')-deoxyribonucleotidase